MKSAISVEMCLVCANGAVNHTLRLWNAGHYERFFIPSLIYLDFYTKVEGDSRVTYGQDKSNLRPV
jgi:hypothetical protein